MARNPDVLIVGGGVIGLTTAYYLARDGVSVQLLDRSAPGTEASWAGAGIIPPGNPEKANSSYAKLRAASSRMFPTLSHELSERTGIKNEYRVTGGIEVIELDDDQTVGLWIHEGIDFEPLPRALSRHIEPALQPPRGLSFLIPAMAQVRNPWHLRALMAACESLGVEIEPMAAVARWNTHAGRIESAVTESGIEYAAGRYLIASGAWTDRLLAPLGCRIGVQPVRGQIVLFNPGRQLLSHIVCVGKQYLVPREDGRILAGSTEEPDAGFEKRTTAIGVAELHRFATERIPTLAEVPIEKSWAGLRPGSPDGLPFMGPVPGWSNAFVAAGHFRSGIQLSPGTARVMSDLLMGCTPILPIEAFRLDRPPAPPVPSAFRS